MEQYKNWQPFIVFIKLINQPFSGFRPIVPARLLNIFAKLPVVFFKVALDPVTFS